MCTTVFYAVESAASGVARGHNAPDTVYSDGNRRSSDSLCHRTRAEMTADNYVINHDGRYSYE